MVNHGRSFRPCVRFRISSIIFKQNIVHEALKIRLDQPKASAYSSRLAGKKKDVSYDVIVVRIDIMHIARA